MKLNDYVPQELLLTVDAIKNVSNAYSNAQELKNKNSKDLELIITLSINLLLNILAFAPSFSSLVMWAKIVASIIMIAIFVYLIISIIRWRINCKNIKEDPYKNMDIDLMLIDKAKENYLKYTAIIRVIYKDKNKTYYLTGKDYFLPHCYLDKNKEVSDQNSTIISCLDKFGISEKNIVSIKPVDEEVYFSIKPVHERLQMNAYVFYDVRIKIQSRSKLSQPNEERKWMTLEKMKNEPEAVASNKDVITLLEELQPPTSSFVNTLGKIRIIWNITSRCQYNCAICATHDENRVELSANEKLTVLNNICKAKEMISGVDFAGGDPLICDESVNIIQAAIEQLGEDKVSITTTGLGVSEFIKNKFSSIIKHCEITIDASKSKEDKNDFTRGESEYCKNNIEQVNALLEYAESLTINVPIINDNLLDEEIDVLIDKIISIRDRHSDIDINVTLLRLMPVGKLSKDMNKKRYSAYNPVETIKKIKTKLELNEIKCKLHCSLRALPIFNEERAYCNMLENKVGIDCAGNIFACPWGGYVEDQPSKNPFYLGNLTKVSLLDILNGDSKTRQYTDIMTEINAKRKRNYCSAVSYYVRGNAFENNDPLSSKKYR